MKTVDLVIMLPYFAERVLGGRERIGEALQRDCPDSGDHFGDRHGDVVYRELRQLGDGDRAIQRHAFEL